MSIARIVLLAVAALVAVVALYLLGAWLRLYGSLEHAGTPTEARRPGDAVEAARRTQQRASAALTPAPTKQILFGDLHVHTTFSTDAFLWSLPIMQGGEGAHPVSDACDYARFCSQLDFWSITDHAEASTPRKWRETKQAMLQCKAVAGPDASPDVAVFLGFEWTQVGRTPADHYGHKNVIVHQLAEDEVPARPIGAAGVATQGLRGSVGGAPWYLPLLDFPHRQRIFNFIAFMKEVRAVPYCDAETPSPDLPADCYEMAETPADLFARLRQWHERGVETMVIPHGNTWGFYTPPGVTWDKQLVGANQDPSQQFLIEVMSGHGNSEQYRDWRAVRFDAKGDAICPEPTRGYLPSCWRAGQIIEQRCLAEGADGAECKARAAEARQLYARGGVAGWNAVPGTELEEWLDSGQCRDCFRPSFTYRPGGSVQYALAISNFDQRNAAGEPRRFEFGLIASSDNHRARPGTGYKPVDRKLTTEANGPRDETWRRILYPKGKPSSVPVAVSTADFSRGFATLEAERQASFFMTGGLAAVHATGRSRDAVWDALERREVYGTSGPRILLWFDLLNAEQPDGSLRAVPMGSRVTQREAPRFEARAVGSLEQKPGCPDFAASALTPERQAQLCKDECYNPSDQRRLITRIEVVRIRPQAQPGENVAPLIEDPWRVFPCQTDPAGCVVRFEDPEFASAGRDALYYVRAIEQPSPVINAQNLRCTYDAEGNCVEVHPCYGDYRTPDDDDCAEPSEERAWSSPIFVNYEGA
jgi:Protein of unknown function (DUF3604)